MLLMMAIVCMSEKEKKEKSMPLGVIRGAWYIRAARACCFKSSNQQELDL